MLKVFAILAHNKKSIIGTQLVLIALVVISMQLVVVLSNLVTTTANKYATNYSVNLTK